MASKVIIFDFTVLVQQSTLNFVRTDSMENGEFFGNFNSVIPEELTHRAIYSHYVIGWLLALSVFMIALAVRSNPRIVRVIPSLLFVAQNTDQRMKEMMKPASFSSLALIFTFWISSFCLLWLTLEYYELIDNLIYLIFAGVLPIAFLVLHIVPSYISRFVTGANLPMGSASGNTLIGYQFFGVLAVLIVLLWLLNPAMNTLILTLLMILVMAFLAQRWIKNSYLLLINGVSWYYLLLYLCTLEILPLFVAYYVLKLNFWS